MKLLLKRIFSNNLYTIGKLYVNNVYFCDTIEDTDRGLYNNMSENEIIKIKVPKKTAIPYGDYKITLNIVSGKFVKMDYYKTFCQGKLPRLLNTKGFGGILIHRGKDQESTEGCIIVGFNKIKGMVINSQQAFEKIYKELKSASNKNEEITISIIKSY